MNEDARDRVLIRLSILLIVAGTMVRFHGVFVTKAGLTHDESVSYLCAAATQHSYEIGLPQQLDKPLLAGDIQRYYERPDRFQFRTVARDLVLDDIHPPLYFWVLHLVHRWIGFDLQTGPLINVGCTLLVLILLFRLGRTLFGSTLPALACCTLWFLSPAVVQIDLEARHYQLFGFIALAMFMVGRRWWNGTGTRTDLLLFTALNTLGFLTHYYYGFLLIPGLLIMLKRWGFSRNTFAYLSSLFASLGLFLVCFPEFLDFIPHYLADRNSVTGGPVDHAQRLRALVANSMEFLSHWMSVRIGLALAAVSLVLWGMLRSNSSHRDVWMNKSGWPEIHLHLTWYLGFTAALYVGGVSPEQAIGGEYFSYIWPLLALAMIHWARTFLPTVLRKTGYALFALHLVVACWSAVRSSPFVANVVPQDWVQRIAGSDMLLTNEGRRGYLPRLVIQLPKELPLRICSPAGWDLYPEETTKVLSYWLVLPDRDAAPPSFVQQLHDAGFTETVFRTDRHELRYFVRE